jgi:hypothetical protein
METVTINITRASVLADMKVKSHAEVASTEDDKARYLSELGTEKTQEANQCINDAAAEVVSVLRPFAATVTGTETAGDAYDTTATIAFTLSVTARKSPGMAKALANLIHPYIVDSALDKFYVAVSRPDLAERHRARLASEIAAIQGILYRRQAPTYATS